MAAKKLKMAAKKFQNEFQGVKKIYIKKQKPLRFHNFMSRPGIREKKIRNGHQKIQNGGQKISK